MAADLACALARVAPMCLTRAKAHWPSREEMEARVRALDRVLRGQHVWVPNWYKGEHWIAHWDVFGRPEEKPPYDRGDEFWWWDEEKYRALQEAGALR